jgi:hypothetical protein
MQLLLPVKGVGQGDWVQAGHPEAQEPMLRCKMKNITNYKQVCVEEACSVTRDQRAPWGCSLGASGASPW